MRFSKPLNKSASVVHFGIKELGPHYWVGKCKNGTEYYASQTFKIPASGILNKIKLFASQIYGLPEATLSIYKFDADHLIWREEQLTCKKSITSFMENQWITFILPPFIVSKNEHFGLKLMCSGTGMMAIAECPWHSFDPCPDGAEWKGYSLSADGKFQVDFNFAFEGEIDTLSHPQFF